MKRWYIYLMVDILWWITALSMCWIGCMKWAFTLLLIRLAIAVTAVDYIMLIHPTWIYKAKTPEWKM